MSSRNDNPPEREWSPPALAARSALGAAAGAAGGLLAVIVTGLVAFAAVRGWNGAALGAAVGACLGLALRGWGDGPARALGGGVGGALAGFFVVASAEAFPPGSLVWAARGGGFSALIALPAAALVGASLGAIRTLTS